MPGRDRSGAPAPDSVPAMTERGDDNRLVWLDLEMTGLDVEQHVIVEIACIVTDPDLTIVDDGIDLVVHQDADAMSRMDDYVRRMHTKSGLLPLIEASTVSLDDAQARVLEYVRGARARRRASHRCAATASGSTAGSSTATCANSTATCTTAASTSRR